MRIADHLQTQQYKRARAPLLLWLYLTAHPFEKFMALLSVIPTDDWFLRGYSYRVRTVLLTHYTLKSVLKLFYATHQHSQGPGLYPHSDRLHRQQFMFSFGDDVIVEPLQ